jgi:hypothetical protein
MVLSSSLNILMLLQQYRLSSLVLGSSPPLPPANCRKTVATDIPARCNAAIARIWAHRKVSF